jgi:hypothetical protein
VLLPAAEVAPGNPHPLPFSGGGAVPRNEMEREPADVRRGITLLRSIGFRRRCTGGCRACRAASPRFAPKTAVVSNIIKLRNRRKRKRPRKRERKEEEEKKSGKRQNKRKPSKKPAKKQLNKTKDYATLYMKLLKAFFLVFILLCDLEGRIGFIRRKTEFSSFSRSIVSRKNFLQRFAAIEKLTV